MQRSNCVRKVTEPRDEPTAKARESGAECAAQCDKAVRAIYSKPNNWTAVCCGRRLVRPCDSADESPTGVRRTDGLSPTMEYELYRKCTVHGEYPPLDCRQRSACFTLHCTAKSKRRKQHAVQRRQHCRANDGGGRSVGLRRAERNRQLCFAMHCAAIL